MRLGAANCTARTAAEMKPMRTVEVAASILRERGRNARHPRKYAPAQKRREPAHDSGARAVGLFDQENHPEVDDAYREGDGEGAGQYKNQSLVGHRVLGRTHCPSLMKRPDGVNEFDSLLSLGVLLPDMAGKEDARIKELELLIRKHQDLYYNGQPEISDAEFDALWDELAGLDPGNSDPRGGGRRRRRRLAQGPAPNPDGKPGEGLQPRGLPRLVREGGRIPNT